MLLTVLIAWLALQLPLAILVGQCVRFGLTEERFPRPRVHRPAAFQLS